MSALGIYRPLATCGSAFLDHITFKAKLLDRSDRSILVQLEDGSAREVVLAGAEISPVSEDGFVEIDMSASRAKAEGIIS